MNKHISRTGRAGHCSYGGLGPSCQCSECRTPRYAATTRTIFHSGHITTTVTKPTAPNRIPRQKRLKLKTRRVFRYWIMTIIMIIIKDEDVREEHGRQKDVVGGFVDSGYLDEYWD